MTQPLSKLDMRGFTADGVALFLDFDGTLVEIAPRPELVHLAPRTLDLLGALESRLSGALAIVSGRSIDDLDGFLAPGRFALAGGHGMERRDARGGRHDTPVDPDVLAAVARELSHLTDGRDGLLVEPKPGSVALHFRQRPELADFCTAGAGEIAANHRGASLLTGKMVVEVKLSGRSKADAVFDFMAETPFTGRVPVYAGDDVTDEDAFRAVTRLKGISIKVGGGESAAHFRVAERAAFLDWLARLRAHFDQETLEPPKETGA